MILKWTEMMWRLYGSDPMHPGTGMYLGEAGNPSYRTQVSAIRYDDKVLVSFGTRAKDNNIIPANTVVKGFMSEQDGRTLKDIMDEGVIYDYALRKVE